MAFFLKHWTEIKKSDNMTQIWQQIRLGKHIGFEEGKLRVISSSSRKRIDTLQSGRSLLVNSTSNRRSGRQSWH